MLMSNLNLYHEEKTIVIFKAVSIQENKIQKLQKISLSFLLQPALQGTRIWTIFLNCSGSCPLNSKYYASSFFYWVDTTDKSVFSL